MSYLRTKKINKRPYIYEQRSERQGGKVRTHHVRYIGGVGSGRKEKLGTTKQPKDYSPSFYNLSPERQAEIRLITESKRQVYADKERKNAIKATVRLYERGISSRKYYYNTDSSEYSLNRQRVHQDIKSEYFDDTSTVQRKGRPTAILLGGPPGSGKTSVILRSLGDVNETETKLETKGKDYVILNSDYIKQRLPEYRGYNASYLHEESSDVFEDSIVQAIAERRNIVLDATLKSRDKAIKKIEKFQSEGYDVKLYATNLDRDITVQRATKRSLKAKPGHISGRYVPIEYVVAAAPEINKSVREVTPYVDEYKIYDTTTRPPVVVMEGSNPQLAKRT